MHPDAQDWFDRRTSRAADWPVDRLLRAKGGQTISVVLPARDEEATVGAIVELLRRELVENVPLVDELVVVDSHSSDATGAVAAAAGAKVVSVDEVLPELGGHPGKGEALWKSLAATTGDLLAFVDADLTSFTPAYVTGLLGPLLHLPEVQYVKAAYERPLRASDRLLNGAGGRVTELVARPILAAHWPQLGGVVQPLSGEYAARRSALEEVRFPTGYGVELGLLVDLFARWGLDGLAQVELGLRTHRNRPDTELGLMAAEVWLTALDRLGRPLDGIDMSQFGWLDGVLTPRSTRVELRQRPPMATVDGYVSPRRA